MKRTKNKPRHPKSPEQLRVQRYIGLMKVWMALYRGDRHRNWKQALDRLQWEIDHPGRFIPEPSENWDEVFPETLPPVDWNNLQWGDTVGTDWDAFGPHYPRNPREPDRNWKDYVDKRRARNALMAGEAHDYGTE